MEDFTLPSIGASFKNGSVVHPFFQIARPILITPGKKEKMEKKFKIAKKGGPVHNLSDCGPWSPAGHVRVP
jgi:hypothetical protein